MLEDFSSPIAPPVVDEAALLVLSSGAILVPVFSKFKMLKLQVCCVDLCAMVATGFGQHAHESDFIVCKSDFKFRMSIAHHSALGFRLRWTVVHAFTLVSESVVRPSFLSVLSTYGLFGTNLFPNTLLRSCELVVAGSTFIMKFRNLRNGEPCRGFVK